MPYELAKQLKDAGWPQDKGLRPISNISVKTYSALKEAENEPVFPTLEELIDACGTEIFVQITYWPRHSEWYACSGQFQTQAPTPTEAVARLWLALDAK